MTARRNRVELSDLQVIVLTSVVERLMAGFQPRLTEVDRTVLMGVGMKLEDLTCEHGYKILDSCPGCDAQDEPAGSRVRLTDLDTQAWTVVDRADVYAALRIWIPFRGVPRKPVVDAIESLQEKLNAGEDTSEELAFLRLAIEPAQPDDFARYEGIRQRLPGPEEDRNRT